MMLSIKSQSHIRMPVSPLQVLILIQLDESPKYGYEMLKSIKEEFEGTWELKTGTLYPALKSLEKKGYVETETRNKTDYYIITEEGMQLFDLILRHIEDSIDFSIKYISTVFKWMTYERKQSSLELIEKLANKEHCMSQTLLKEFTQNIDIDLREPILIQIKNITQNRLKIINNLMEKN
jgi:DNA-binding PadR family transcriptional regulator